MPSCGAEVSNKLVIPRTEACGTSTCLVRSNDVSHSNQASGGILDGVCVIERVLPFKTRESREVTIGRYPNATRLNGEGGVPSICYKIGFCARNFQEPSKESPVIVGGMHKSTGWLLPHGVGKTDCLLECTRLYEDSWMRGHTNNARKHLIADSEGRFSIHEV